MGTLLLWIGLTIILAFPPLGLGGLDIVGAVIMIIGCILLIARR